MGRRVIELRRDGHGIGKACIEQPGTRRRTGQRDLGFIVDRVAVALVVDVLHVRVEELLLVGLEALGRATVRAKYAQLLKDERAKVAFQRKNLREDITSKQEQIKKLRQS